MKTVRKTLILAACAIMLVCATIAGTLAYLTDTKYVTNTFTVGNVGITLNEAAVNPDGTYVTDVNNRTDSNEYKLLPGHSYIKDPKITVNAGSEDCYLFVEVENGLKSAEGTSTIASQMASNHWVQVEGNVYVYATLKDGKAVPTVVTANDEVPVFGSFTISGNVDGEALSDYADAKIKVTAYAIQADGFADKTVNEIWTAVNE